MNKKRLIISFAIICLGVVYFVFRGQINNQVSIWFTGHSVKPKSDEIIVKSQKAMKKYKTLHEKITVTSDQNETTIEADIVLPDKYQGSITDKIGDKITKTEFTKIGEILYTKPEGSQVYYPWMENDYQIDVVNLLAYLDTIAKFDKKETTKINNTDATLYEPKTEEQGLGKFQLWFDKNNLLIQVKTILDSQGDNKTNQTIIFSDFNKQIEIKPPADDQLAR